MLWNEAGSGRRDVKLPNAVTGTIPESKVTRYLLSEAHPHGRHKAVFFRRLGFSPEQWEMLAAAIREHAVAHDVARTEESPFGLRYIIEGRLVVPGGRTALIRSVWFIERGEETPRFVTAYPMRRTEG